MNSDVVLEARPWPRDTFCGLGPGTCGLCLEGPGLSFESCIDNYSLASPFDARKIRPCVRTYGFGLEGPDLGLGLDYITAITTSC